LQACPGCAAPVPASHGAHRLAELKYVKSRTVGAAGRDLAHADRGAARQQQRELVDLLLCREQVALAALGEQLNGLLAARNLCGAKARSQPLRQLARPIGQIGSQAPRACSACTHSAAWVSRSSLPVITSSNSSSPAAAITRSSAAAPLTPALPVGMRISSTRRLANSDSDCAALLHLVPDGAGALDEENLALAVAGRARACADQIAGLSDPQRLIARDQIGGQQPLCQLRRQLIEAQLHLLCSIAALS
jgi:hypothetical protein